MPLPPWVRCRRTLDKTRQRQTWYFLTNIIILSFWQISSLCDLHEVYFVKKKLYWFHFYMIASYRYWEKNNTNIMISFLTALWDQPIFIINLYLRHLGRISWNILEYAQAPISPIDAKSSICRTISVKKKIYKKKSLLFETILVAE